jgi:hypothetical protein
MKRKIAILLTVALLLSTGIVYAASVNGNFAGLPIVNVKVNGETVKSEVPGVVLQGKTLLPASAIAESLDSVVTWDQSTMTASITKPEVNMLFVDDVKENSDGTWDLINPFTYISPGYYSIKVFYQIGEMQKQQYDFKIAVKDPDGETIEATTDTFTVETAGIDGWTELSDIYFAKAGKYIFEYQIKFNNEYKTVAHKTMIVE